MIISDALENDWAIMKMNHVVARSHLKKNNRCFNIMEFVKKLSDDSFRFICIHRINSPLKYLEICRLAVTSRSPNHFIKTNDLFVGLRYGICSFGKVQNLSF